MARRAIALVLVLGSGCVADTSDLGAPLLGDAGAVPSASVFDPARTIVPGALEEVSDQELTIGVLQGAEFRAAWSGRHVAFAWLQNVQGEVLLAMRTLDLVTRAWTSPVFVGGGDLGAPSHLDVTYADDHFAIVWSTATHLGLMTLTEAGGPRTQVLKLVEHGLGQAPFVRLFARSGALVIFAAAGGEGSPSFLARVGADDALLSQKRSPVAISPVMTPDGEAFAFLASERAAAAADRVSLAKVDAELRVIESLRELYTADSARGLSLGPEGAPAWAAVWDFDRGSVLVELDGGRERGLSSPGYGAPTIAWDTIAPRVLVIREIGALSATNPIATGLEAAAIDYENEKKGEPLVIYDGAPNGECIEHTETLVFGDRVGVAFVTGCPMRTLRFLELGAK